MAGIDVCDTVKNSYPVFQNIADCDVEADVVIDFSSPVCTDALLDWCADKQVPVVECTTGLSEAQLARIKETSAKVAVLKSANMSMGINLLEKLLKEAAGLLAEAGYDIEIVEKHHKLKKDAPSGTAIKTAKMIAETNKLYTNGNCDEIETVDGARGAESFGNVHIHSVRMPGFSASQEVLFGSDGQTLSIRHDTSNRKCYMQGVMLALRYAYNHKEFVYGLDNIL